MVAELADRDERHAVGTLIATAERIARGEHPEMPEDFVAALFGRAVAEDLMHYEPRQL